MKRQKPAPGTRKAPRKSAATKERRPSAIRYPLADPDDNGEANRACELLDTTAAAWVTAIRWRVKELADEMGRIDYLLGHPEACGAGAMVRTVLDMPTLGRLAKAINEAEECFDDLLSEDAVEMIPNLPNACRIAAASLGMLAKASGD